MVGELVRREAGSVLVGYEFDLRTNEIRAQFVDNQHAGREHRFRVYRHRGPAAGVTVVLRDLDRLSKEEALEDHNPDSAQS